MRLFTVDIQTDDLEPSEDPLIDVPIREKKAIRDEMRRRLHQQLSKGETTTWVFPPTKTSAAAAADTAAAGAIPPPQTLEVIEV